MGYQEDKAALTQTRQATLDVLKEAAKDQAILVILKQFPALNPNEANSVILKGYFGDYDPRGWLDAVREQFTNNGPLLKSLSISDEAGQRKRFIEQIVASNGGSPERKAELRRELSATFNLPSDARDSGLGQAIHGTDVHTTAQLAARAERTASRAELKQRSPEELKQILRDSRTRYTPPTLPAKYDKAYILAHPEEIKNLVRLAGSGSLGYAAVNRRLQGVD